MFWRLIVASAGRARGGSRRAFWRLWIHKHVLRAKSRKALLLALARTRALARVPSVREEERHGCKACGMIHQHAPKVESHGHSGGVRRRALYSSAATTASSTGSGSSTPRCVSECSRVAAQRFTAARASGA